MKCTLNCPREAIKSAVIGGVYYPNICHAHISQLSKKQRPSSGHAAWERGRDLEDHEADIAQPYSADGKPNPVFIRAYPEKARQHFSDEEIRKYG